MNTWGNKLNKIAETTGGWQQVHKLAKQEIKSLLSFLLLSFYGGP